MGTVDRAAVVAYATAHGPTAASRRYGVPLGSVKSWQVRARKRRVREQAQAASQLAHAAATAGQAFIQTIGESQPGRVRVGARRPVGCGRCGDTGRIITPAVTRGGVTIRQRRRLVCPDCGDRRSITAVVWPRREWEAAMAAAGDLGMGWSLREWEEMGEALALLLGEPKPSMTPAYHYARGFRGLRQVTSADSGIAPALSADDPEVS